MIIVEIVVCFFATLMFGLIFYVGWSVYKIVSGEEKDKDEEIAELKQKVERYEHYFNYLESIKANADTHRGAS